MRNGYGIYLTVGNTTARFPVNPQEPKIEYPEKNERYDVLGLGEVVQARLPGLAQISWSDGLLPGEPDGDYVLTKGAFHTPDYYIDLLNRCKRERLTATLTIDRKREDGTGFHPDTFPVLVEDFEVREKGGETGDFYYSVSFTEYRDYKPTAVTIIPDAAVPQAATAIAEAPRETPQAQMVVGSRVTVNGKFFYSSYGEKPFGNGNGRTAVVGRIITTDPARPCPILLKTEAGGLLGWCKKDVVTVL